MKRKFAVIFMTMMLCVIVAVPVFGEAHPARLVDSASLLTAEEEGVLLEKLDAISERQQVDVHAFPDSCRD